MIRTTRYQMRHIGPTVYGDTDSVFLKLHDTNLEKNGGKITPEILGKWWSKCSSASEKVSQLFKAPNELEHEVSDVHMHIYTPCLICTKHAYT